MLRQVTHLIFLCYTILLITRICLSWFPSLYRYRLAQFTVFYTDPYLNIFKRAIPPIGGVLDLSPILGFLVLRFAENLLLYWLPR